MEIEFEFHFSDVTMLEADGDFHEVNRLMTSEFPYTEDWMIRTDVTIDSPYGIAQFTLHCFYDGKIYIVEFNPSIGDVFYNPDIQALTQWALSNGWSVPEPTKDRVKDDIEFWRHYWQSALVDSAYLDKIYGEREHLKGMEQ